MTNRGVNPQMENLCLSLSLFVPLPHVIFKCMSCFLVFVVLVLVVRIQYQQLFIDGGEWKGMEEGGE